MNRVHAKLVTLLREATERDENTIFTGKTDEQVVRMMFGSFRGRDQTTRGMRLTNMGLQVMTSYFQAYQIKRPEGRKVTAIELLYLDRRSKLPYFVGETGQLVMFDPDLGIKLKLCDGDIQTLIDMDDGI